MGELDQYLKRLNERLMRSIERVFRRDLVPAITRNLMRLYDEELVSRELSEDPARPSVARDAFESSVRSSLLDTLSVKGNEFSLSAGDIKQLGYDSHSLSTLKGGVGKNPSPLEWLVFYLEGFIGNFVFVSAETYTKLIKAGVVPSGNMEKFRQWGWYGNGFLVPEKEWIARGLNSVPGVNAPRHPFSGKPPVAVFERALEGIDVGTYIDKAIAEALRG